MTQNIQDRYIELRRKRVKFKISTISIKKKKYIIRLSTANFKEDYEKSKKKKKRNLFEKEIEINELKNIYNVTYQSII